MKRVTITAEMAAEMARQMAAGAVARASVTARVRKQQASCGCAACKRDTSMWKKSARGSDDDRRQIIADLISNDDSPFTPDDADALAMTRDEILQNYRDTYLKPRKAKAAAEDDTEGDDDESDVKTMVRNAVANAFAGLGLGTRGPSSAAGRNDAKSDARRKTATDRAKGILQALGIASPTPEQVSAVVEPILAALDESAEPATTGNPETVAQAMAREAEHRGDNRAATYLHGVAAVNADLEARRARSDRYAEQQRASRLAANAAKPSDDPAVRAMTEHSGGLVGALQRRGK